MRQDFEKGKIENSGEGEIYPYSASSVDCPIVKEVLQGLDLKDWALALATMDFLRVHKMKLEKEESREVLGRIESEEGKVLTPLFAYLGHLSGEKQPFIA